MRVCWKNFTGGELAPSVQARYDLEKYNFGVAKMENMVPGLHGDVQRRLGTRFIGELEGKSVLIPFCFSTELGQNFVLIFSNKKMRVADEHGLTTANVTTPYAEADLYELSYAQSGDIVYLAHKNYPLHKLMRTGSAASGYSWALQQVRLNTGLSAPGAPSVTFERNNKDDDAALGYTLRYKITAVDEDGNDSLPSSAGSGDGKHPTDWVVGNRVVLSWSGVSGAKEYNIYREEAGYYGLIGVSTSTSFIDANYEADTSDTPKEDWNPFANSNNPATVAFHQQRLVLAGTKTEPSVFYMSKTGQYEGFRKSRPLQDDDPIEFMIASGSIDQIVWAVSFGDLLLGTSGAEYKVTADGEAITPKTVGISTQSFWGSAKLAPLIIGNSVLHSQRFGGRVRDLYYSLEKDGYQGNDLSIMAPHLFDNHTLLQWCYQQTPGSNVWCVRDDGVLLCLTYLKEHNIYGWSRHKTNGRFVSVCTINGASADVVMCVVERTINGQRKYFLERMADQFFDNYDIKDAFFVDCGKTVTLPVPGNIVSGLEHLEGATVDVLADGSPVVSLTVADGSVTLPYDASVVQIGIPYTSTLGMLPMEADIQTGSTLGKQRGYGKAIVRFISSVGGKYGAEKGDMYDIPFLPENWGEACVPFTGDVELIVPGGQASNSSLTLVQDRPLPFHITAVAIDVDFGEV